MTEPFGTRDSLHSARDRARLIKDELDRIERTLDDCVKQANGKLDAETAMRLRGTLGGANANLRNSADELNALASRIQRVREGLRSIQDRSQQVQ